jgi:hypothetical protein
LITYRKPFRILSTETVVFLAAVLDTNSFTKLTLRMALLEDIRMTGSLGNLSFYYMRGVDKIVVRTKGGPSKEYVENAPTFAVPRLNMSEFGGCSKMGKEVRFMMHPVRNLADYNFSGFINKALKIIQKQDSTSALGQRSIKLSQHPHLLAGFQLNKNTTFDSVIRTPVSYTISRENLSAQVSIPALLRDINFNPNNRHARFRIEASLGIVPDFTFDAEKKKYQPPAWYTAMFSPKTVSSPWYPALKGSPATSLDIKLTDQIPADEGYSLMLTVGVRYGSPMEDDVVTEVKRAGVGKVIAVGGLTSGATPEDKKTPDDSAFSTPVHALAPCTFGWRATALVCAPTTAQLQQHPVKTEPPAINEGAPENVAEEKQTPVTTKALLFATENSIFPAVSSSAPIPFRISKQPDTGPRRADDWPHGGHSQ